MKQRVTMSRKAQQSPDFLLRFLCVGVTTATALLIFAACSGDDGDASTTDSTGAGGSSTTSATTEPSGPTTSASTGTTNSTGSTTPDATTTTEPDIGTSATATDAPEWTGRTWTTTGTGNAVLADGETTDLFDWGGWCIGDCERIASIETTAAPGTRGPDDALTAYLFLNTLIPAPAGETPDYQVLDALRVELPAGVDLYTDCHAEGHAEFNLWAVVPFDLEGESIPVFRAWLPDASGQIVEIPAGDVTCIYAGD